MCRGLGPNKHDEISEIDRARGPPFTNEIGTPEPNWSPRQSVQRLTWLRSQQLPYVFKVTINISISIKRARGAVLNKL